MSNNKDFKVKNGIKPTVYHEAVGTVVSGSVGYNLAGASYDSKSFSVASQETVPIGLAFNDDGTAIFVVGYSGDAVFKYTLSTAYDISTASYSSTYSVVSQATDASGVMFNPSGTKMYVTNNGTPAALFQYTLSTGFDITTATYDSVSFDFSTQDGSVFNPCFNSDGTKLYVAGNAGDSIYQYSLSTAYDISSMSYDSVSLSVSALDATPVAAVFNNTGTVMYLLGGTNNSLFEYSLSTAYDISTASYTSTSFTFTSQDTAVRGIIFKPDGTKMYAVGVTGDTIYQYSTVLTTNTLDLSTGSVFELTPTSDITVSLSNPAASGTVSGATLLLGNSATTSYDLAGASYDSLSFSVAAQEASPGFVQFKPDGTKMYVGGSTNDVIYQYSLSAPWDVSTSSYDSVSFSVTAQENNLRGLYIKPDGLKFYTIGIQADVVHQYTMSTAWDMSTASYDSVSFSVTSQEGEPQGIFFKTDGTKMFVVGSLGDEVNEYSLSTAWDISTASFTTNFVISGQDTNPNDIYFKDDGTKFWISGDTNNTVYQYSCSTPWDISTASYDSVSFSVATQETGPQGITFGYSGTKLYVVGAVTDTVYQYSVGSGATITYDTAIQWAGGTAPTSPAIGETDVVTFSTRDGGTTYSAALAIDGAQ